MPELPEVETTCAGIRPHIEKRFIKAIEIRESRLRWPIEKDLADKLLNKQVLSVTRRGKYALINFSTGTLAIHLGMSGSLRILKKFITPQKHDHVDIVFKNNVVLRFRDPRRFGAIIWLGKHPEEHALLKNLGPEPLSMDFNAQLFFEKTRKRKQAIKQFIMNASTVVGVGNIYANEALFAAGILPQREAASLTKEQAGRLVEEIKGVLSRAIAQGGSSLKDFEKPDGKPGYFVQSLQVYGRSGEDCQQCGATLKAIQINKRTTIFCPKCQK